MFGLGDVKFEELKRHKFSVDIYEWGVDLWVVCIQIRNFGAKMKVAVKTMEVDEVSQRLSEVL